MKKINSLNFSICILKRLFFFIFAIPLTCKILLNIFEFSFIHNVLISSFIFGIIILFVLFIIWFIEYKQDKFLNDYYAEHMRTKNAIENNRYECQHCGYQHLTKYQKECPICYIKFESGGEANVKPRKWFLR